MRDDAATSIRLTMASGSMAPGSMAPGSMAPGSMAPGSMGGSKASWTASSMAGAGRRPSPGVRVRGAGWAAGGAPLFADLDITFAAGRWTALMGRSGVGKSSILRAAAGLLTDTPDADGARFDGVVSASDGAPLHNRLALMAQDPGLSPWMRAREAAALGPRLRREPVDPQRVDAALAACGLAGLEDRRPAALSGGQRQRVAIARTLVEARDVVLLDEPLTALDALTAADIADLLWTVLADRTVILVTHDPLEAAQLAHDVVILRPDGAQAVALDGAPKRAWDAPETIDAARRLRTLTT